ncbi:MAG: hypothetical protein RM368_08915 [Nostoc sp. DedSLP03]|nr:hypothetical protein [Nostoc sp. DedSLP03]MDZ7965083.1 hypothetical protein [Nostoc sp. DedSLP03]
MDWAIGKFTTISQIVELFGQAVYLDVKQYDNEQSSTARKNLHLKSGHFSLPYPNQLVPQSNAQYPTP